LIVFGGPEDLFCIYSPMPSLRGQPTGGSPSQDWQSTVGWGDSWILNPGSGAKPGPTNNIFSDFALLKKIIPDPKTPKSGIC
jgi:hypothetical protein